MRQNDQIILSEPLMAALLKEQISIKMCLYYPKRSECVPVRVR